MRDISEIVINTKIHLQEEIIQKSNVVQILIASAGNIEFKGSLFLPALIFT